MLNLLGPSYRYQGEKLASPTLIYICDHHYDEQNKCFHVEKLLENSLCDPQQHLLIFDHVVQQDNQLSTYNCLYLPLFLASSCAEFNSQQIQTNWNNKITNFNFMINKQRLHRQFLLLLLDYYDLKTNHYTLCWKNVEVSRRHLKKEIVNLNYQSVPDTPITHQPKQFLLGHEILLDKGLQCRSITNSENYQKFLQTNVFEPSCISLITEPALYEKETIITEKTIMALYGGTIPIWVGGWRIPDYMKSLGFDIFDDIVDHSYQSLSDPYDRCYYAIEKNIDLLRNFNKFFTQQNQERLVKNVSLLKDNVFLNTCNKMINEYSGSFEKELKGWLKDKTSWLTKYK
jgi:hypothetical protein